MSKILTSLLLFFAASLAGQNAAWQHFYPNPSVSGFAARGNTILVATEVGLARFDTLGNATVYDAINTGTPFRKAVQVTIDHAGAWWVAHHGGVAKYDGNNWSGWDSTQVGLSFYNSNATALKSSPDGRIGVATSSVGCAVFENNVWTTLKTTNSGLPSDNVRDLAFGADGKIYFATGAGLAVWDGSVWAVYNATNTGLAGFNNCKSVTLTSAGIVWVTESTNRFAKLEAGVWTEYTAADIGISAAGFSLDVVVDGQDRLWLTYSKSISVLEGGTWTHYLEADIGCTLLQTPVTKIRPAIDGAGQLWFWTSACDLLRFDGQTWNKMDFSVTPDLPGSVYAITQDTAGDMWFGGFYADDYKNIARKNGDNWETFNPVELGVSGTPSEVFTAHGDVLGNVWFALVGGEILRFDGTEWSVLDDVIAAYPTVFDYWTINSTSDGTVWFSCLMNGPAKAMLARYKDGDWTFFSPGDIPLPVDRIVLSIAFGNDNTAWFLSNGGQLLKFDGINWEAIDIADSGLPFMFARRMAIAPDGAVWVATDAGLARFDGTAWTTVTTANSDIPSDNLHRIAFDKAGGMYIGFNPVGLSANIALLRSGEWSLLMPPGPDPGFSSEPFEIFTDRDNRLWFTGFQGYTVYLYDPMLVNATEPVSSKDALAVFPNPASNVLYIQMPGLENQRVQIRVTDPCGRLAYHQTATVHANLLTLHLPAEWPAGLYYVETFGEQGERQSGRFARATQR